MPSQKYRGYIIGGIVLFILIIWVISAYNSLVKKDEKVKLQWNEVQNTYQRRLDLLPNLVNIVKGESGFEQTTLEKVAEARSNALAGLSNSELTAENVNHQNALQDSLASNTNRVIFLMEKYPVLKGTAAYKTLQVQLEGTERRIRFARTAFNAAVADYNKKVRSFPTTIISGLFGFKSKEGFEADAGTDKAVEIKF